MTSCLLPRQAGTVLQASVCHAPCISMRIFAEGGFDVIRLFFNYKQTALDASMRMQCHLCVARMSLVRRSLLPLHPLVNFCARVTAGCINIHLTRSSIFIEVWVVSVGASWGNCRSIITPVPIQETDSDSAAKFKR